MIKTQSAVLTDNAAAVRKLYAAFARHDIQRILDALAEDVEWIVPGSKEIPYAGIRRGKTQVAEFFKSLGRSTEINRFEPREFVSEGERVAVAGYYDGWVKPTGRRFEEEWVMLWTLRNGKIIRLREYMNPASLEAAFKK